MCDSALECLSKCLSSCVPAPPQYDPVADTIETHTGAANRDSREASAAHIIAAAVQRRLCQRDYEIVHRRVTWASTAIATARRGMLVRRRLSGEALMGMTVRVHGLNHRMVRIDTVSSASSETDDLNGAVGQVTFYDASRDSCHVEMTDYDESTLLLQAKTFRIPCVNLIDHSTLASTSGSIDDALRHNEQLGDVAALSEPVRMTQILRIGGLHEPPSRSTGSSAYPSVTLPSSVASPPPPPPSTATSTSQPTPPPCSGLLHLEVKHAVANVMAAHQAFAELHAKAGESLEADAAAQVDAQLEASREQQRQAFLSYRLKYAQLKELLPRLYSSYDTDVKLDDELFDYFENEYNLSLYDLGKVPRSSEWPLAVRLLMPDELLSDADVSALLTILECEVRSLPNKPLLQKDAVSVWSKAYEPHRAIHLWQHEVSLPLQPTKRLATVMRRIHEYLKPRSHVWGRSHRWSRFHLHTLFKVMLPPGADLPEKLDNMQMQVSNVHARLRRTRSRAHPPSPIAPPSLRVHVP